MVFGQCVITCHQTTSGRRIAEEELSRFSKRFEECCGVSVEPLRNATATATVKAKDETEGFSTVEVGCEAEELRERVIDRKANAASQEVSVHQSESALSALHREIQFLKESIREVDRKAFPFGKWSSLPHEGFRSECKSVHRFHMSRVWPPEGIISFLRTPIGGNAFDNKTIDIVAKSVYDGYPVSRIAEFDKAEGYLSKTGAEQYVYYDFKNMRVLPRGYSIRTNWNGPGSSHLRSWVIEATDDLTKWVEIDSRPDNSDLNSLSAHQCYPISEPPNDARRFIRLKMIGKNHNGNDYLYLAGFELFGDLEIFE
jgi:hypothetical protein